MITLPSSVRIYLAAGAVDLRKSIDGLGAIVMERDHDLHSGHLYVFVSRRGDRLKILTWSAGGFLLLYKRLKRGRFRLPEIRAARGRAGRGRVLVGVLDQLGADACLLDR